MATGTSLGTRIKRAREKLRWSQQKLADALGVNIKTIDNWEHDRTMPRSSIGALEDVLGIRLSNGDDDDGGTSVRPSVSYEQALDQAQDAFDVLRQAVRERQEGSARETTRRRRRAV